jgi:RNA polymerase subunit RPABC4/transcription elongation factor Spt4
LDFETFIARGLQVLLALGGAYLIATWFVLAIWTFRDIESRSRSVITQVFSTLLVVLFWVPGWLLYRLLRPKETLDEAYQRSLEEEYLLQDLQELPLCQSCNHFVDDEWRLCPHCNTQLREDCSNCGRLIDLKWDICPYCAAHHEHTHGDDPVAIDDDRWIDPAAIEERLRTEEARRIREETRALPATTAATTLGHPVLTPSESNTNGFEVVTGATVIREASSLRSPEPDLSPLREPSSETDEAHDDTTVPQRYRIPGGN